ncbi:MAG: FHA domain-containing serine/threonine-protein kinase [Kofleriaceae bacterium]
MKLVVYIAGGPASGRVLTFAGDSVATVGRGADVEISVPADGAMSRKHVQLAIGTEEVRARDLESKHGVFLNGVRVHGECRIANADVLQAGETVLRFELEGGAPLEIASTALGATEVSRLLHPGEPTHALEPPAGFELVRLLGAGAMGSVHLARRIATGEVCAIKQILPRVALSEQARRGFLREASVQRQLDHEHIVRVYDLLDHGGGFQLVMEYVDGPSGDQLLTRGAVVAPATVVEIGCQVLEGLAYAHDRNIVHRDIKEANLLFPTLPDGSVHAKIADFGLAKNFQESGASGMTQDGMIGGTLPYMAREQLLDYRFVKPPADIYALGATMYRLLTGLFPRHYRDGDNPIRVTLEEPIIALRDRDARIPRELAKVVETALEASLDRRYASARQMLAALGSLRGG